jgi:WD40 repeat protein
VVYVNGLDGGVRVWDRRRAPQRPVRTLRPHHAGTQLGALHAMRGASSALDVSRDARLLLTGSAMGGACVWDVRFAPSPLRCVSLVDDGARSTCRLDW